MTRAAWLRRNSEDASSNLAGDDSHQRRWEPPRLHFPRLSPPRLEAPQWLKGRLSQLPWLVNLAPAGHPGKKQLITVQDFFRFTEEQGAHFLLFGIRRG